MNSRQLEALEGLFRNGSFWIRDGNFDVINDLKKDGYVERNKWSGDWQLSEHGKAVMKERK